MAHHGLIRILIEDSLKNLRIPITLLVFRDFPVEDDIKTLTYDVSPSVSEEEEKQEEEDTKLDGDEMDEEETNTEEHDEAKQKGGEEKEDDAETKEETNEETNGDEKEQQEEERIKTEGEEHKEESPRVSLEAPKRELVAALTTLSNPIKQKGKRRRQTPLYFRTRESTRIKQGKPQISTKIPIEIEDSPTLRYREAIMRDQLERENAWLRGQL